MHSVDLSVVWKINGINVFTVILLLSGSISVKQTMDVLPNRHQHFTLLTDVMGLRVPL